MAHTQTHTYTRFFLAEHSDILTYTHVFFLAEHTHIHTHTYMDVLWLAARALIHKKKRYKNTYNIHGCLVIGSTRTHVEQGVV